MNLLSIIGFNRYFRSLKLKINALLPGAAHHNVRIQNFHAGDCLDFFSFDH